MVRPRNARPRFHRRPLGPHTRTGLGISADTILPTCAPGPSPFHGSADSKRSRSYFVQGLCSLYVGSLPQTLPQEKTSIQGFNLWITAASKGETQVLALSPEPPIACRPDTTATTNLWSRRSGIRIRG